METDPRGPRFSALITTVVLAVVLITGSVWLLAAQAVVFAVGSVFGLRYSPIGVLYRRLIRRSGEELRQLYAGQAGLDFGQDTIAHCRIGERSAHTWLSRASCSACRTSRTTTGRGPSMARWWASR
jgi:Domain of unknown function (DUF4395)